MHAYCRMLAKTSARLDNIVCKENVYAKMLSDFHKSFLNTRLSAHWQKKRVYEHTSATASNGTKVSAHFSEETIVLVTRSCSKQGCILINVQMCIYLLDFYLLGPATSTWANFFFRIKFAR